MRGSTPRRRGGGAPPPAVRAVRDAASGGAAGRPVWRRRGVSDAAALILAFAALTASGIGCPFRWATGVPCPGCGMTRAYLALARLDFRAAAAYHPLFWAVPALAALAWAEARIGRGGSRTRRATAAGRGACRIALGAIGALAVAGWAIRLLDPADAGLLPGGALPSGVPPDIIHIDRPGWAA